MRDIGILSVIGCVVFVSVSPALGHHSFAAQFDPAKPVTLEGTVTKVEWRNPHIWVYLDVTGEDGTVTSWECEGGAPNALTRQGWTRQTLELGTTLEVRGYLARTATNVCNARTWIYNGRTVFAGSANDGGPVPE
jgi:hypothetical protein